VVQEVVVDRGVVHAGEAVLREAGRQILRRVEVRGMGRVRPGRERWHQVRAPPDQVDLDVRPAQPAADEESVVQVDAGEVGRILVQPEPEHDQPGQRPLGKVRVELGARLDLESGGVERDVAAEHGLQWITGHHRRVVTVEKASGSLFGLAYGDALGKPTEFQDYETIVASVRPAGPRELTGDPALVTDDTQMMLAVGEALVAAGPLTPAASSRCCGRRSSTGRSAPTTTARRA
jgi:hypothetical protein